MAQQQVLSVLTDQDPSTAPSTANTRGIEALDNMYLTGTHLEVVITLCMATVIILGLPLLVQQFYAALRHPQVKAVVHT